MFMMPTNAFTISDLIFVQASTTSALGPEAAPVATPCRTETTLPHVDQTPEAKPVPAEESLQKVVPSSAADSHKPDDQSQLPPEPPTDAGLLPRKAGDVI